MDREKFSEVIGFAIDREQEAAAFYKSLQEMAKFSTQKAMLADFEEMEKGHVKMLERFWETGVQDAHIAEVEDLKISDYLVAPKPAADMTYQDILITAMKKEEKAQKLYTKLAGNFSDPDVKQVFETLAGEEAKHKNYFERIYDEEVLEEG